MTPALTLVPSDLRQCCLSSLFCQSGAFVLNGAISQYGHNCQPPAATAAGVSPLLHHDGENTSWAFYFVACTFECNMAATRFALWARAELLQIYTASYSCRDGGGEKSWKTTEMQEYMQKTKQNKKQLTYFA